MTLPPLLQNALKQLQQEQVSQAQATARLVEKQVGQTLTGIVTESTPLTETERQQALERLQRLMAAGGPAGKQALQQLADWSRQANLHLVGLQIGAEQRYALSPQPLKLHQLVQVLVRADGQLQLLEPASHGGNRPALAGAEQLPQSRLEVHWQTIAGTLRSSLPHQKPVALLVALLNQVDSQLKSLPTQQRDSIVPPAVRRALENLQRFALTPADLARPERLQQSIRDSGMQLEAQLAQMVRNASARVADPAAHKPATAPKISAAQLLANLQTTLARQSRAATTDDVARPLPETDTKAALLYALKALQNHQVGPELQQAAKPAAASDSLVLSLLNLLQRTPPREKGFVNLRNQLLQALQQQLGGALAKIQTQQLQSLSQRLGETGTASAGGSIELPVRLADGYSSIGIHIQEHWQRDHDAPYEQDSANPEPAAKVRQWEVMLDFNLADAGELAAQLKVTQDRISTSFWAEKAETLALAEAHLSELRAELENSGLHVKEMRCLQGLPPQKQVKFNYNLVDIRT